MNAPFKIDTCLPDAQAKELADVLKLIEAATEYAARFQHDHRRNLDATEFAFFKMAEAAGRVFADGSPQEYAANYLEEQGLDAEGYPVDEEGYRTTVGPVAWVQG